MSSRNKLLIPVILYGILYLAAFRWLEVTPREVTIIYSSLDSKIPFCEYFIIPYLLWFLYIAVVVLFFIYVNDSRSECIHMFINFAFGMTLFIIISYVFPNGLLLRPTTFERDNIFIDLCKLLWKTDTATNVFPSIHVYNSMAAYFSLNNCARLRAHPWIRYGSLLLSISIVLSTMFLKQHSIIDVVVGLGLSVVSNLVLYRVPERTLVHELRHEMIDR